MTHLTAFERIAEALRVRDIYSRFAFECDENDTYASVLRRLVELEGVPSSPVLVRDSLNQRWLLLPDWLEDPEDCEYPLSHTIESGLIELGDPIAADVSLLTAIEELSKDPAPHFPVVEGRSFVGVLCANDFLKIPGRMCLMALTLELEVAALELCSHDADVCWNALPSARQEKAYQLFVDRLKPNRKSAESEEVNTEKWLRSLRGCAFKQLVLDCTMFVDKATMLCRLGLLVDHSKTQTKNVFTRAERLRNLCAHPEMTAFDRELSGEKLLELVRQIHDLTRSIRDNTPKKRQCKL